MRSTRFEVIVVADADGLDVARRLPFADRFLLLRQTHENIAVARNTGIATAVGDIIAFIDDDAVPEPCWAEAVLHAFADPVVQAVTGPVLGRNGISLQWGRMAVSALGVDRSLPDDTAPDADETLKLHGTNMAIRRACLIQTGLFDTGFRFFLDETDLARRIWGLGLVMAYEPRAVVHHGFAASARRTDDRIPLSLYDIGASSALFLAKHAPARSAAALDKLVDDQRARLLRLARKRALGPTEMHSLMESLIRGIADGRDRISDVPPCPPLADRAFLPMRLAVPPPLVRMQGWAHRGSALRREATVAVAGGSPVAVILLDPTPRKHSVAFTDAGWWEQRGGLYGPSDRGSSRLQLWRFRARAKAEWQRTFPTDRFENT
jgi:GT2 family glycosyltransferase